MISITNLFEAISAVDDRMNYASERIATLQRAFKAGRISAKIYQQQLKQFQQVKRGVPSKEMPESEIKAAGTYLNTQQ